MTAATSNDSTTKKALAILRITLGLLILATWFENLQKGVYTAGGIVGLFDYIFEQSGGGPALYRQVVGATILQVPGLFASVQLVLELLMALGLLFGGLTPLAAGLATLFFANLFVANLGGSEWIWTYVLMTVSGLTVTLSKAGRTWGIDAWLLKTRGEPRFRMLW